MNVRASTDTIVTQTAQSPPGASLTARAFWLTFAKSLSFVLGFALPLLLVRRLDQIEFGSYKQAFLVITTATTLLPLGFGMSAYFFLPREAAAGRRQVIFNILLFHLVVGALALIVLLLKPTLLARLFNAPELTALAPHIGVVIMLWITSAFLETIAVANGEMRLATVFIIVAQLTKTILMLLAALLFASLEALVYAAMIQSFLQTVILFIYLRSRFGAFWRAFDPAMLYAQLAYALPLGGVALLYVVQTELHNYYVANRFGAQAFAIYAIGCFQLPLFGIVGEAVASVMIPQVSLLRKQERRDEILRLTGRAIRKVASIYLPAYIFLTLLSREFVVGLFTEQYAASQSIFVVNLLILPFSVLMLDPIIRAYESQAKLLLRLRVVLLVILLAGLWLATARLGLVGAITAVVFVRVIEQVVMAVSVGRTLGVRRDDWRLFTDVGKIAVASIAAGAAAFGTRALVVAEARPLVVLVLCAAVFGVVYAVLVWQLHIITPGERAALHRQVVRSLHLFSRKRPLDPLTPEHG